MARIYWIQSSATPKEAAAMIALSKALPESWTIICNKILFTDYGRSFELD